MHSRTACATGLPGAHAHVLLLCPMPLQLSHFFKRRISVCCGLPPAALPTALASFAPALDARQPPPVTPVPPIAMPSEGEGSHPNRACPRHSETHPRALPPGRRWARPRQPRSNREMDIREPLRLPLLDAPPPPAAVPFRPLRRPCPAATSTLLAIHRRQYSLPHLARSVPPTSPHAPCLPRLTG